VDDELHRDIQEFQRAVETRYYGADPMTCEFGRDYTLVLRSVGPALALGARDRSGRLIGLVSMTVLRLRLPNGRWRRAQYVAHLHVLPECRHGMAIAVLVARCVPSILTGGGIITGLVRATGGFTPSRVSRALGLPGAHPCATMRLVTYPCAADPPGASCAVHVAPEKEVRRRFLELTAGRIVSHGGDPSMRSALPPRWLIAEDGSACGCIEDYHATTRWRRADGSEYTQSNISFFGWRDPSSAAGFVRACLREGRALGAERIRIILDEREAEPILAQIGAEPSGDFRWTMSAGGLWKLPDAPWVLHPSEI